MLEEVKSGILTLGFLLIRKRRKSRGRGLQTGEKEMGQGTGVLRRQRRGYVRALEGECCRQRVVYLVLKFLEVQQCAVLAQLYHLLRLEVSLRAFNRIRNGIGGNDLLTNLPDRDMELDRKKITYLENLLYQD